MFNFTCKVAVVSRSQDACHNWLQHLAHLHSLVLAQNYVNAAATHCKFYCSNYCSSYLRRPHMMQ